MVGNDGKLLLAAVLAVTFVAAAVLYHVVEEPARRLDAQDGRRWPARGRRRDSAAHRSRAANCSRSTGPRKVDRSRFRRARAETLWYS